MTDYKLEGNLAFKAGKYAEAFELYTKAISENPTNPVLYNNRSGALFELKEYEKAIGDARKSIELSPTTKAYNRLGAAYWAQEKYELSLNAYEMALALSPNDINAKENIDKLKFRLGRNSQSSRPTAPALTGSVGEAGLDLLIIGLAGLQFIFSILLPTFAVFIYKALLACMCGRSFLILKGQGMAHFTLPNLKSILNVFAGQYFILCLVLLVLPFQPLPTIMGSIVIYSLVDISGPQRGTVARLIPSLERIACSKLDSVRQNRDGLLINAAMCEIASAIISIFTGNFIYGMLLLQFFLNRRYRTDSYSKYAWTYIAQGLGRVFYHQKCPSILTSLFEKVKLAMFTLANR